MNNRLTMKTKRQIEFGDFQTPVTLAVEACSVLRRRRIKAASIVEPTCGVGNFLAAAINAYPSIHSALGTDVNLDHLTQAKQHELLSGPNVKLLQADFFQTDWDSQLSELPDPLLIVGNPPWVCNSELGAIGGRNLPTKTNNSRSRGIEAITGKSNFDVSEWMMVRLLEAIKSRDATLSMLCKTSVARKVLQNAWQAGIAIKRASIHRIDSQLTFGVAVDACLLTIQMGLGRGNQECAIYSSLSSAIAESCLGVRDERLVANIRDFDQSQSLLVGSPLRWRSGIKHDCAKVMELRSDGGQLHNGFGDVVDLESTYLYPMLKSSDLASTCDPMPSRWMLVPQRSTGDDTHSIKQVAPKTWRYLNTHSERLDRRASSIYRGKPPFSIFGIGDYTFAPWKVAISGLYKQLTFKLLGPHADKPIVLDDTCYSLGFATRKEANDAFKALTNPAAQAAFASLIFWDSKRPITAEVLNQVDYSQLFGKTIQQRAA